MTDDDQVWSNKLLLKHATVLQKARAFLPPAPSNEVDGTIDNHSTITSIQETWPEAVDELSGLGAIPKSQQDHVQGDRRLLSANEKLREQLLSRHALNRTAKHGSKTGLQASKPKPLSEVRQKHQRHGDDEDEEDQDGRSKVISRKRGRTTNDSDSLGDDQQKSLSEGQADTKSSKGKQKRPLSYLDQVLAERQRKRNKQSSKG